MCTWKVLQLPLLDRLRFVNAFSSVNVYPPIHLPSPSQANVLWLDTGKTLSVSLRSLHPLPHIFLPSSLPPLAIPAVLEGLHSTFQGEGRWFPLDVQLLWKHLLQKKVYNLEGWLAQPLRQPPPPVHSSMPGSLARPL